MAVLELRLLGEFRILRDGVATPLPPSRKTRALLAYLAASGGTHRRNRLSALLWELPDDPRGSLRRSLSKLRALVDDDETRRIRSDRETVALDAAGMTIDLLSVRELVSGGKLAETETDRLVTAAALFHGDFLEGLDMPNLHEFHEWCLAERENTRDLHARILRALLDRFAGVPERAIPYARLLVRIDSFDADARASLIRLLDDAGRRNEAKEQYEAGLRALQELGPRAGEPLTAAWRAILTERDQPESEVPVGGVRDSEPVPFEIPVAPSVGIVGRDAEASKLLAVLAQVRETRQARLVLITGEPGIGKTRLAEELVGSVRRSGGTVLDGVCYEVEAARAFGPWIDALRQVHPSVLGPNLSADLAPLLPELSRGVMAESSRERMFGAVAELVAARAHSAAPVLLLIDDVHWIDEASAELLHYVIRMNRHRPLLVALTGREGELPDNPAMQRILRALRRTGILEDILLRPLDAAGTAALVGTVASDVDAAEVFSESAGNPLYVIELARALNRGQETLPHSLSELVRDRIERLPQAARDAARWASILGRSFSVPHLEALVRLSPDDLVDSLETLARHSIVKLSDAPGQPVETCRFLHELLRRAVYYDISEPRRRLMHARTAKMLTGGEAVGENVAAEVVRHAALAGDEGLAASACLAAGTRCLRIFANTEAEILARRGLRHAEALAEPERTMRQIELTRVLIGARRPDDLDAAARDMNVLAERALDLGALPQARLGFQVISYLHWEGGFTTDAQRATMHAEMISRSAGDDGEARIEALAEAAKCLLILERDLGQAEALVLEADALSTRSGTEISVVPGAQGMLCLHRGELDEAERLLDQARLLARRDGNRAAEFHALEQLAMIEI